MKQPLTLLIAPLLLFTTACSTHYAASSHARLGNDGYGHHGRVSVGIQGGHHGGGADVLGALIVGGIIGHLLTQASNNEQQLNRSTKSLSQSQNSSTKDELVNGYVMTRQMTYQVERNSEQNRFYRLGKDGNCYLMEKVAQELEVISMVPQFSCR